MIVNISKCILLFVYYSECETELPGGNSCDSMEFSTYPDLLDCAGFWQCYAGCPEHMQVYKCHQKYTDKKENQIFLISEEI